MLRAHAFVVAASLGTALVAGAGDAHRPDSKYGGAYGTVQTDPAALRHELKQLSADACPPEKHCEAAKRVRELVFGRHFTNHGLADFIVYFARTDEADERVYGPVLSQNGRSVAHLYGQRQIYALVFSDTPLTRVVTLTTLRPKANTPLEVALSALAKVGLASPPATPEAEGTVRKTIAMSCLGPRRDPIPKGEERCRLYFGMVRLPIETDTVSHISVGLQEEVAGWTLRRTLGENERTVSTELTRTTTAGGSAVVEETLTIPEAIDDESVVKRYAAVCDAGLPARNQPPAPGDKEASPDSVRPDPDLRATLDLGTFPSATKASPEGPPADCALAVEIAPAEGEAAATGARKDCAGTVHITPRKKEAPTPSPKVKQQPLKGPFECKRVVSASPSVAPRAGGFFSNSDGHIVSVSVAVGGMSVPQLGEGAGPTTVTTRTDSTTVTRTMKTVVPDPEVGDTETATEEIGKDEAITTSGSVPIPEASPYATFYVLGKLYLLRPRLEARSDDFGLPYRPSVALVLGTTTGLDQLVLGVSLGHVVDRAGLVVGRNYVRKSKTLPEAGWRWFFALEYAF